MGLIARLRDLLTPEEINGDGVCSTYLYRWTLLRTKRGKLYLHHFVGSDWARDMHDHPKAFLSIGLWGSYIESRRDAATGNDVVETFRAPWFRIFGAEHTHRLDATNCWTLCFVGEAVREWGFYHQGLGRLHGVPGGLWVKWDDYVREYGEHRKRGDC